MVIFICPLKNRVFYCILLLNKNLYRKSAFNSAADQNKFYRILQDEN